MALNRRLFVGGAAAVVGSALTGIAHGANKVPPVTRQDWDAIFGRNFQEGFTCVQAPQMTEGPFYNELSPRRRDITEGQRGEPLRLGITLGGFPDLGTFRCLPLAGAVVDIWQANADCLYSNVGPDIQQAPTIGETFLRGHQVTDDKGYVEFDTIVPGWEVIAAMAPVGQAARTTHIHVKVYHERQVLDTQLFFPDPLIGQLYATTEPYRSHGQLTAPGSNIPLRRLMNTQDFMFLQSNSRPMQVERVNGTLFAQAVIGMTSQGNRGIAPLFRSG